MNLDTSLGNALRKLRMKNPEGSAEWILITTRMANIQIMIYTDDYDDEVFATLNS